MAISMQRLTKRFGDFVALDDVSLEIRDGSLTALLGPSGSGKTTLLRIIAGLDVPDSGTVLLDDRDVTHVPPQDRGIGFVFQHYAPFKHMTVWDNVAFGLTIRHRPKDEIRRTVGDLLDACPDRPPRRPLPGPALRRPAPAHGPRPRPGHPALRAAAGRTLRGSRRPRPQGAARLAAAPPRRIPRDDGLRDPRPGRGHGRGRPHRRHGRRTHRAAGHGRASSTSIPPTSSS